MGRVHRVQGVAGAQSNPSSQGAGPVMKLALLSLFALTVAAVTARSDEGMWLFTNPPRKALQDKYQFDPTPDWLEHLQKASVRFPHGSASFVSPNGLVITNHHVG